MKTTRVGGGHPGYLVRSDPRGEDIERGRTTYQQDLWHYTVARMVDACVAAGILPYYGPFGDIRDTVACEDQFRNAYLLGCVGAWSLHPVQIAIAKKVFSPEPAEVAWARKVIAAMGDGTGAVMIDGKMQDDATVKQCHVVAESLLDLRQRIRRVLDHVVQDGDHLLFRRARAQHQPHRVEHVRRPGFVELTEMRGGGDGGCTRGGAG